MTRLEKVLAAMLAVLVLWYLPATLVYRFRHPEQTETQIFLHTKDVLLFR